MNSELKFIDIMRDELMNILQSKDQLFVFYFSLKYKEYKSGIRILKYNNENHEVRIIFEDSE